MIDKEMRVKAEIISRGLAEVKKVYKDQPHKRDGAIEGFEIARALTTQADFERVLSARERRETKKATSRDRASDEELRRYWQHRYCTLQIEFVYQRMLILWAAQPLNGYSARAVIHVQSIMEEIDETD